jgi:glycerol-3-phosphate dehydrogenase (NAD(P)+)
MTHVLIIGAGDIGQAIGRIISPKATVGFWDKDQSRIKGETDIAKAIQKAEIIFICAPSWANRDLASQIAKVTSYKLPCFAPDGATQGEQVTSSNLKPKTKGLNPKIVISLSKGIAQDSHKLVSEILDEELSGKTDFGVMAGPMIAEELTKGQASAAIIGLSKPSWQKKLQSLFENSLLNISFSSDLKGLSLCSVLKNIYAIGLGMADELKAKTNMKSIITDKALKEMLEIVPRLGGQKETVLGVAGLGDLLATGWSGRSYNFAVGQSLVRRQTSDVKRQTTADKRLTNLSSEGIVSLESIAEILGTRLKHYQLLDIITAIILRHANPKKILELEVMA